MVGDLVTQGFICREYDMRLAQTEIVSNVTNHPDNRIRKGAKHVKNTLDKFLTVSPHANHRVRITV